MTCEPGFGCASNVDCSPGERCTLTAFDDGTAVCRPECCAGAAVMCAAGEICVDTGAEQVCMANLI
jgi:hypothetical protein